MECINTPALASLSPDANDLILVGQVFTAGVVVGPDHAGVAAKEVLGTSLGGQVVVVAAVLSDLQGQKNLKDVSLSKQ